MKIGRQFGILLLSALVCTGCSRTDIAEKAPGVSDEAYDLVFSVLDTAEHYTELDKARNAYRDEEGTAPLLDSASLMTLNTAARMYGMPADKSITDCEYVDLTKYMSQDDIIFREAGYLGPCAIHEGNMHVCTGYGAGITKYNADGTVEVKCTPTPPEIDDYIQFEALETGVVQWERQGNNLVFGIGADIQITNTGWTKGIPAVTFFGTVYNEDDEVVATRKFSAREVYVPAGVTTRIVLRDGVSSCGGLSDDTSIEDVNLNGLYLMINPCIGLAAGANDYTGTLVEEQDYTVSLVSEKGAVTGL